MLFICYPKCSTCRKAEAWLQDHGFAYTLRDIKTDRPTAQEIAAWQERSGLALKSFFNTSGMLYREMELSRRLTDMSREEQLSLLGSDGMLVKRPILVTDEAVLVGFRADKWAAALGISE